jgi:hypothetical protein
LLVDMGEHAGSGAECDWVFLPRHPQVRAEGDAVVALQPLTIMTCTSRLTLNIASHPRASEGIREVNASPTAGSGVTWVPRLYRPFSIRAESCCGGQVVQLYYREADSFLGERGGLLPAEGLAQGVPSHGGLLGLWLLQRREWLSGAAIRNSVDPVELRHLVSGTVLKLSGDAFFVFESSSLDTGEYVGFGTPLTLSGADSRRYWVLDGPAEGSEYQEEASSVELLPVPPEQWGFFFAGRL